MSVPAVPLGTLEVALAHAQRLLARDPAAAAEQAAEILKVHPDLPEALALSGLALGYLGRGEEAGCAVLDPDSAAMRRPKAKADARMIPFPSRAQFAGGLVV